MPITGAWRIRIHLYGHESVKRHKCKCCVLLETNLTIITDGNHDTQRSVKIPFISYLESPSSQNTSQSVVHVVSNLILRWLNAVSLLTSCQKRIKVPAKSSLYFLGSETESLCISEVIYTLP